MGISARVCVTGCECRFEHSAVNSRPNSASIVVVRLITPEAFGFPKMVVSPAGR